MARQTWLGELVPLKRPEYAKQTEVLLTDLLWRSPGSTLAGKQSLFDHLRDRTRKEDGAPLERLVPRRTATGSKKLTETYQIAGRADIGTLIDVPSDLDSPTTALLESIAAPRASGMRSIACVPVFPDAIAFQTLHGLVNKQNPANLADIVETVGWLGGANERGDVARRFLTAVQSDTDLPESPGFSLDELIHLLAETVWTQLERVSDKSDIQGSWPQWSTPEPSDPDPHRSGGDSALKGIPSPFSWFWDKWETLCDVDAGWHAVLPPRRFIDWALCILRTGLAFSYLWEAEFFLRLYESLVVRDRGKPSSEAIQSLRRLFNYGPGLAKVEPRSVPGVQKHVWPGIESHLARGYMARETLQRIAKSHPDPREGELVNRLVDWVESIPQSIVSDLDMVLEPEDRTAKNQQEFVRYLLQQRSADADSADQADLYYLLHQDSRSTWFEPGPEWIVVVASLLCRNPSGSCTLSRVVSDFSKLGLQAERSVITTLLEEAGLSTDSPDADEALVVHSGF